MKSINISVKLTEADFLKFSLQRFYQSLLGRIITTFGVLLIVVPPLLFFIKPEFVNGQFPVPQFLLGVILTLGVPLLIFRASKKAYFGNTHLAEETEYKFGKDDVGLKAESFSIKLNWSRIVNVIENNDFFLLYITKNSSHIIPKQQLTEKQHVNIRDHIKAIPNLSHELYD